MTKMDKITKHLLKALDLLKECLDRDAVPVEGRTVCGRPILQVFPPVLDDKRPNLVLLGLDEGVIVLDVYRMEIVASPLPDEELGGAVVEAYDIVKDLLPKRAKA